MKKRALAALICLIMVFALLPTAALAGTPVLVKIGGKTLTYTNCYYINGEGGSPGTVTDSEPAGGEWNAYFEDRGGNGPFLTLKGLNLSGYNGVGVEIDSGSSVFTIKLNGTNTVAASTDSDEDAVHVTSGGLTIEQEGTDGSLNASTHGAGNGIVANNITLKSGSINGTATGSGNGINVAGSITVQGGSAYGNANSGIGVFANAIQYSTGGGLISGTSYNGYGVSVTDSVDFFIPGTLIASGGAHAVDSSLITIKISPSAGAPLTADPDWCTVTTSENTDGSSPTVLPGGDAVTGTAIPYTYGADDAVKYLKIAPAGVGDWELVLSVTGTGAPAAPGTDYTYSAGRLDIIRAGSYTLSMAEGVSTTAHNVELKADGVELTLDNVTIESGAAAPLKSSSAGGTAGNTLKLNGTNVLTATYATPGLAVNGKLTIADGDGGGTGSLTATGDEAGAGIGVSGADEGMELTVQSGTVTAYGGEKMVSGTLVNPGPGIGSNYNKGEDAGLPEPVSVTITGGTVYAEGAGGIATSIDVVTSSSGPAQITVIISGGVVTGKSNDSRYCGIGGTRARVEISGGTVAGEGNSNPNTYNLIGSGIGGTDHQRDDGQDSGVFISGGTVTATGSTSSDSGFYYGGAGIGGVVTVRGIDSYSAKVVISGGTVTATGGHNAAGIGGSSQNKALVGGYADVTINGGTVTAAGGAGGRAIGAGNIPIYDDTTSSVSIAPGADKALLVKFAGEPVTDWSGVTDSVSVGSGTTLDYKADAHYDKLSAHVSTVYAVSGTVKDEAGAPVSGATVSSGAQSTTTDSAGAYKLMLENGSHTITAAKGDMRGTKNITVSSAALTGQDITLTAAPAPNPAKYQVIKGQAGKYNGGTGGLHFTANGDYSKFTGVSVDGNAISGDKYTSKSGSTIVMLKASYLKTLSAGRHTLRVNYSDGYADTYFTIRSSGDPIMGDNSLSLLWLCIAILAVAGFAVLLVFGQRKRQNG